MKPQWHTNLVLICEKCGKKISQKSDAPNLAVSIKDFLKKELVSSGNWGKTRVVNTSCLDFCPEGKIAVAFLGEEKEWTQEAFDPQTSPESLLKQIRSRAPKS